MAPLDNLSPAGSSTYSSNTMYVGDGTWDATRNDFLLPNLVGLNFETMRYNGMGNRFAGLPQYHQLIKGHGIVAVITFLFIVPSAILIRAFYGRSEFWAMRMHIYLQILTVALTTVVFTLGWFAVGPERSLTNPHHGIGLAIYVLVLWQAITGWWMYGREKGRVRRKTVKKVLHQWLGRATALLAFAQVPLGLTLYGSPKWTFILYALWMFFLLVLFFILSYRAQIPIDTGLRASSHGGTVIEDRKPSRFGGLFGPLAAGAGAAALLSARKNRNRSRSRSRSRVEVIPSRRGSGSYIEEEKYDSRRRKDEGGGMMDKLLKGAAVLGAAGLAKSWYDGRKRRREEDTYSSVAPDTPSRRHDRRRRDSDSTESVEVHRMEEGRTNRPILPGPGDPVLAAAAMSAATPRPVTPRPVRPGARRDSYDSDSYYDYESTLSPSRRPQSTHKVRNGLLAGLGVGWFAKKMKDRRDRKEEDRLARIEDERIEEERRARRGQRPQRLTGDGFPASRHGRRGSRTQSSDLSSVIDNPHDIRPGGIPPVPAGFGAGAAAGAAINQSQSRHDITHSTEPVSMPPAPHDPQGILHPESGSESYMSPGGHPHRRHSERRRREGEAAMAAAVGAAATLAAEEERRRQRSQSRHEGSNVASPPVSVKVKVHDDKDRHVTLRRLTEQEAAAEREARRSERHRRRADSLSSLSGTDTGASRRRYRRDERDAERRAETSVPPPPPPPPPVMEPLSPPNPAFAGGRRPKDSAYYSGRPGEAGASGTVGASSVNSPESHATWSAMSPDASQGDGAEAAAERRRRRRLERNARNHPGGGTGTVDFT